MVTLAQDRNGLVTDSHRSFQREVYCMFKARAVKSSFGTVLGTRRAVAGDLMPGVGDGNVQGGQSETGVRQ